MVGFAMEGKFPDLKDRYRIWLDRFLIDEKHQGKGYGSTLLNASIEYLIHKYQCKKIYLSLFDDNKQALAMYEKIGFKMNGELDLKGELVMVLTIK